MDSDTRLQGSQDGVPQLCMLKENELLLVDRVSEEISEQFLLASSIIFYVPKRINLFKDQKTMPKLQPIHFIPLYTFATIFFRDLLMNIEFLISTFRVYFV